MDRTRQSKVEEKRKLRLYEDKLVTKYREFKIDTILEITHRFIHGEGGFLYLHTNKGVFSYVVKTSPDQFIGVFRELKEGMY